MLRHTLQTQRMSAMRAAKKTAVQTPARRLAAIPPAGRSVPPPAGRTAAGPGRAVASAVPAAKTHINLVGLALPSMPTQQMPMPAAQLSADAVGGIVAAVLVPFALYMSIIIAGLVLLAKAGAFRPSSSQAYGFAVALAVLAFLPTGIGHAVAFCMACAAIHMLGTTKGALLGVRISE